MFLGLFRLIEEDYSIYIVRIGFSKFLRYLFDFK